MFCYADNYIWKLRHGIDQATDRNIPYAMKCDNDVFITADTFDFMFENLDKLDSGEHLTLSPVLSSGIPTVEYFLDQFLEPDEAASVRNQFLQTKFTDNGLLRYSHLNKHTLEARTWNKEKFYEAVKNTVYPRRGIHPVRVNDDAIHTINKHIMDNKDKFYFPKEPLSIIYNDNSPYLCNSIFCIKTDTYRTVLYDHSLYEDLYDEMPLNKYAWNNSMNHLFVKNGFGIHMMYNWNKDYHEHEENFCHNFFFEHKYKKDSIEYHDELIRSISAQLRGIEIGGPSQSGRVIYEVAQCIDNVNFASKTTWSEHGETYNYFAAKTGKQFIGEMTDLNFIADSTYDFVFASHVLEHIANPLKALRECVRVLRDNCHIILILPDKNVCFDHRRNYTQFKTLLTQYENGVGEDDTSTLPEVIGNHDLSRDPSVGSLEEFVRRCLNNRENRCIHHFVYSEKLVRDICGYLDVEFVHTLTNSLDMWFVLKKKTAKKTDPAAEPAKST
jgi:SAM-dependent methyltransferase